MVVVAGGPEGAPTGRIVRPDGGPGHLRTRKMGRRTGAGRAPDWARTGAGPRAGRAGPRINCPGRGAGRPDGPDGGFPDGPRTMLD